MEDLYVDVKSEGNQLKVKLKTGKTLAELVARVFPV